MFTPDIKSVLKIALDKESVKVKAEMPSFNRRYRLDRIGEPSEYLESAAFYKCE